MSQVSARMTDGVGGRPSRVAVVCGQGAQWRIVAMERNGRVRLVGQRSVARGDVAGARAAVAELGATRIVRLIPAGAAVCRLVELPEGEEAQVRAALSLVAEAEAPASVSAHRRASGLLALPGTQGCRVGATVAWLGSHHEARILATDETWTAEPIALLALVASGAGDRDAPRYAVAADREAGSIAIACCGYSKTVVRILREDGSDAGRWEAAIRERLGQALASVGFGEDAHGAEISDGAALLMDDASRRALTSLVDGLSNRDEAFWSEYGMSVAAGAAFLRAGALTQELFNLTADAPSGRRAIHERFAQWIAQPRHAAGVIAASLAVMLLAPLAGAALRLAVLNSKSGGLERQREVERAMDTRLAFLRELEQRRWPMTKLVADIGRLAPVGVVAESVRLEAGQRVSMHGRAKSLELVGSFQSAVNASGVFSEAVIDRQQMSESEGARSSGEFEFDLSARVVRPFGEVQKAEDFASQTLAQRMYGERASLATNDSGATGSEARPRGRRGAASRGAAATEERASRDEAPAAITDEDIAKMDRVTAMKEWTRRQSASRNTNFDEATRERLKTEAEKAKTRFTALRDGGSGGGS